jgi:hypothetical protein
MYYFIDQIYWWGKQHSNHCPDLAYRTVALLDTGMLTDLKLTA